MSPGRIRPARDVRSGPNVSVYFSSDNEMGGESPLGLVGVR